MEKNKGQFIVFLVLTLLAGCSAWKARAPIEQQFQGVLLRDKKPAASARVRLITARSEDCDAKGLETVTDKRGRFQMNRVGRNSSGSRPFRLCVQSNDSWDTIWSQTKESEPQSVEFECDLADKFKDKCWVSWDRQGFKRGDWAR